MRIKGLEKAKDDWNALRNHRMEHYGFCVSNEFFQPSPFFWNREGCDLPLMGQYRGSSIFFICNGPSLASGKYDLTLLKRPGIMTYGINNGVRTIRPNLWTCVDDPQRFIKSIWFDPQIMKIVPHSFAEKRIFDNETWGNIKTVTGECPNMVYFHRNEKFMAERWLYEDTINWGNSKDHGGGRSVMLAALKIMFLMGFRNVFLMGADFKMTENYTYNFDEQRSAGAIHGNMSTYQKLANEYFPALKPHFEAEGFNVYNCNPESELKVFDYVAYEDAIAFASAPLGDVDNERTWGMYSKPDERQKWVNEPDDKKKIHLANIPARVKTPIFIDKTKNVEPQQNVVPVEPPQPQPQQVQQAPARPMPAARPMPPTPRPPEPPEATTPQVQPVANSKGPRATPMNKVDPRITMNPTNPVGPIGQVINPNVKIVDLNKEMPVESQKGNRIIRSMPCGGGISFGSSGSGQQNVTIEDNGR